MVWCASIEAIQFVFIISAIDYLVED